MATYKWKGLLIPFKKGSDEWAEKAKKSHASILAKYVVSEDTKRETNEQ